MNSSGFGTIIEIGDVLVSEDVVCEFFACDYEACGGACCVEGESGAPLEEAELEGLEEGYPEYEGLMSEAGRERVAEVGFFEVDRDGDLVTPCVRREGACAFCHFGGLGCRVAGEPVPPSGVRPLGSPHHPCGTVPPLPDRGCHVPQGAQLPGNSADSAARGTPAGVSGFPGALCAIELAGLQKPVSCALYPIRITRMPGGGLALNLHRWGICKDAFEKGRREGIRAYQFLRGPIERRFGPDFYEALSAAAEHIL